MNRVPRWTTVVYALIAFIYLDGFPYHPALRSPNELCRLWQSRALIDDRALELNGVIRREGYVGDLSVKDGKYYPSKAPLLSFAAAPIYALQRAIAGPEQHVSEVAQVFWSRLLLTVLPTLLMLPYLRRFLRAYLSDATVDVLVPTYALGSMCLNYSWTFVSHQTTAVLVFFAFYVLFCRQQGDPRARLLPIAGVFAGAAVACEYTAALPVIALAAYAVAGEWRGEGQRTARLLRAGVLGALGAAPFLLALMAYHQAAFGHPFESGYKHLADAAYQGWHVGGFLGIRLPRWSDFTRSFVSPLRGLFTESPWLLLAIPGLLCMARRAARLRFGTLVMLEALLLVGYTYFTASFTYESWGWTPGPRHLTPWLPFLALPAGLALEAAREVRVARPIAVGVAYGVCALSIAAAGATALINYIPDTLSTALFGAVVPLLAAGYFPDTVLGFFGVAHPVAGVVLAGSIAVVALIVLTQGLRSGGCVRPPAFIAALCCVGLYIGLIAHATQHNLDDQRALELLHKTWSHPPSIAL